jgi:hypothetical protein
MAFDTGRDTVAYYVSIPYQPCVASPLIDQHRNTLFAATLRYSDIVTGYVCRLEAAWGASYPLSGLTLEECVRMRDL